MIGEILIGDKPYFRMEDNGSFTPIDPTFQATADFLNVAYSPTEMHEPGDSGRPFGVAALYRAAAGLKGASVVLAKPPEEPKPGEVY